MSYRGFRCSTTSLVMLFLLALVRRALGAISCAASVQSALNTISFDLSGLNFPCCQVSKADCHLTDADCMGVFSDFASCISAAGSAACGISFSPTTGSPCAIYKGTVGPYGVSPVAPGGLQFNLDNIVLENWPNLGLDNSVVLCCLDRDGPCHIGELDQDDINPCDKEEYELFCVGDAKHGMCTVRANTTQTQEIGQYFRINLDPADAPPTSISSSNTPGISATPLPSDTTASETIASPSKTAATRQPQPHKTRVALVVALPVALGLLLVAACALLFTRWRKRTRKASDLQQISPVQFVTSTTITSTPISSGSGAASDQPFFGGKRAPALIQTGMPQAHTELNSDWRSTDPSVGGVSPPSYSELRT